MSTNSPSWYIPGEGKQPAGPFTSEQIVKVWQAGRLRADAVCWREGMPQWLPMSQVEPFASIIRSAAAGPQDQSPPPSIRGSLSLAGWSHLPPRLVAPLIGVSIVGVLAIVLVVIRFAGWRWSLRYWRQGFQEYHGSCRQYRRLCDATERSTQRPANGHSAPRGDCRSCGRNSRRRVAKSRDCWLYWNGGGNHSRGCQICRIVKWEAEKPLGYHYDRSARIREGGARWHMHLWKQGVGRVREERCSFDSKG